MRKTFLLKHILLDFTNYLIINLIGELEVLLEASIRLSKAEADKNCEPCQRFYREGLLTSFTKVRSRPKLG